MVEGIDWHDPQLVEAVLLWTGFGDRQWPSWDESRVQQRFGADAPRWLNVLKNLAEDFYASNAKNVAGDLQTMAKMAMADFMAKYPNVPEEISKAFVWCYTFDLK